MRERNLNEKAAINTLGFLRELNERCDGGKLTAITWLSDKYGLSHNTGAACKDLKIIVFEDGVYKWVPKAPPGRHMALNIMDNLLHRSKKKVDPPTIIDIAGFADKIVAKLDNIAVQNERVAKGRLLGRALHQSPGNTSSLFGEVESKLSVKTDLLKAVLTGLYSGRVIGDLPTEIISTLNGLAITVVDDVYNKFYAAK